MEESEQKAIEILSASGYTLYDNGIIYRFGRAGLPLKTEIIPWQKIRDILYNPGRNNINVLLWETQSGSFSIILKPEADIVNVYNYLASKFISSVTGAKN